MNISVVIPTFSNQEGLLKCLKNIGKHDEIIIINNNPKNNINSVGQKNVLVINNKNNRGFAAAVNQGVKMAKNNWVAVINDDVLAGRRWFLEMKKNIDSKTAIIGGTVVDKSGKVVESRGLLITRDGRCRNKDNGFKYQQMSGVVEVEGVNMAAVLINKDLFMKLGGLDEDFFAYEEDVDFCLRVKKSGYCIKLVNQAVSRHYGGVTSKKMGNLRARMDLKNWIFIIVKNFSIIEIRKNFFGILVARLGNFKYLWQQTKPKWTFPFWFSLTLMEVLLKLPRKIFVRIKQNDNRN